MVCSWPVWITLSLTGGGEPEKEMQCLAILQQLRLCRHPCHEGLSDVGWSCHLNLQGHVNKDNR